MLGTRAKRRCEEHGPQPRARLSPQMRAERQTCISARRSSPRSLEVQNFQIREYTECLLHRVLAAVFLQMTAAAASYSGAVAAPVFEASRARGVSAKHRRLMISGESRRLCKRVNKREGQGALPKKGTSLSSDAPEESCHSPRTRDRLDQGSTVTFKRRHVGRADGLGSRAMVRPLPNLTCRCWFGERSSVVAVVVGRVSGC